MLNILHRHWFLFSLFVATLAGCAEKRPAWVMSEDKIVPILKDMQIAYAGVDVTVSGDKNRQKKYAEMNALILDKYGVKPDSFYKSYQYYQDRPELLDQVYMTVIEKINLDIIPLEEKNRRPKEKQVEGN